MIKKALEYLLDLKKPEILTIHGAPYTDKQLNRVYDVMATPIETTTLTSLVDYIKTDIDALSIDPMFIHVVSPGEVVLISELNDDLSRDKYMKCEAMLPNNIRYARYVPAEEFNIMLQSSFVDTPDKALLLKVTGLIQEKIIKETGDDGISQQATIKSGIAKIDDVIVPNPVTLAPYRTFPEIEQPESRFIFRMQTGPQAALFEADGGAWRNEAMVRIKSWLEERLVDYENIKIIS